MRVYVAGAYSAPTTIEMLDNMRKGMRLATELLLAGHSPFCPFVDYHYQLQLREGEELTLDHYYNYSLDWLKVSEAVVVVPGWENSKGTKKEIEVATELGIPVFFSKNLFLNWNSL